MHAGMLCMPFYPLFLFLMLILYKYNHHHHQIISTIYVCQQN